MSQFFRILKLAHMGLVMLVAASGIAAPPAATPRTRAALLLAVSSGYGATLPIDEYEAEAATTNGNLLGPDVRFGTLAAEASGRRAVLLAGAGRFVEFTLARAANAIVVRYAMPDSVGGRGRDASLTITADGTPIGALAITSRYSWYYGVYPFSNRPADGGGHHMFDHARLLLDRTLPAGTRVRLLVGAGQAADWVAIDLADFEQVPLPARAPAGAVSLVKQGGDATGRTDSAEALARSVGLARRTGRTLWVPPGTYRIDGHVEVDRVTIQGAGLWWSVLRGRGLGLYGRAAPIGSRNVVLRDLSIIGEVDERRDDVPLAGIGGALNDSLVERVWIQHEKVGVWLDGPMHHVTIRHVRIMDTTADGVNFHQGVTDATVEDSLIRGTGDDGLAAWSYHQADGRISFRRNTVIAPILANGIALYGGHDLRVEGNLIADTLTEGGGIHVGNRFDAVPAAGRISIRHNLLVRAGSFDPHWRTDVGSLWFYALDHPLTADIRVTGLAVRDPVGVAVSSVGSRVEGVQLDDIALSGSLSLLDQRSRGSFRLGLVLAPGPSRLQACGPGARTPPERAGLPSLPCVRLAPH